MRKKSGHPVPKADAMPLCHVTMTFSDNFWLNNNRLAKSSKRTLLYVPKTLAKHLRQCGYLSFPFLWRQSQIMQTVMSGPWRRGLVATSPPA
jgi:hypothetical protein